MAGGEHPGVRVDLGRSFGAVADAFGVHHLLHLVPQRVGVLELADELIAEAQSPLPPKRDHPVAVGGPALGVGAPVEDQFVDGQLRHRHAFVVAPFRPSRARWNRPAWVFSARARVENQSAISSKPSSRAVLAKPGYIAVNS